MRTQHKAITRQDLQIFQVLGGIGLSQGQKLTQEARLFLTLIKCPRAPSTTDVGLP